jgi:hypothetical protein
MQRKLEPAKHFALLVLLSLAACEPQDAPKGPATLDNLMDGADVIMAARILRTDYSRTHADGPMVATAEVVKCIRGTFSPGDTFDFAETGWWGPDYKEEETRILFLNRQKKPRASTSDMHVPWHTAYADSLDFFIASESLATFSEDRLESFLKETRALQQSQAKLSAAAQGQTKDSFIIFAHLSSPDQESLWIHRETFTITFHGKKGGTNFVYVLDLPIPIDRKADPLVEIKAGQPLTLRFEIKKERVEGMAAVDLLFVNRALLFPRRCWSGLQSVQVKLVDE